MPPRRLVLCLILCGPCFSGGVQEDTVRLGARLKQLRVHQIMELPDAYFSPIQREYLAWIDSRIETGASVSKMNAELAEAHLLSSGPRTVDDMFEKSYAGFLGEIKSKPVRPARDVFAIVIGIHTGVYCNFDDTVVLYARNLLRRVARINAEQSHTHGYLLRDFTVSEDDPSRGRMIGSAWVASNCTSNWNENIFRIDLIRGQSHENALYAGARAFSGDELNVSTAGDRITFRTHPAWTTALAGCARLSRDTE